MVAASILALLYAVPATAGSWVWPVSYAESTLEREYQTTDPWALRDAREQLAADLQAGYPESSRVIRHDRQDVAEAGRGASPRWAHCRGADRADRGLYGRFHCTVRLDSSLSGYEATKRITLVVRGRSAFRVLNGWR